MKVYFVQVSVHHSSFQIMQNALVMKKAFTLLTLMCAALFTCISLQAQNGTIKGKIKDSESGEALVGANVVISGTSQGAATDASGLYSIANVTPGEHTLEVTYTGFQNLKKIVRVKAGETAEVDFSMGAAVLLGQEVVVSASRKAEKLTNAPATITVINSKAISELPSFNVAELLGRQRGVDYVRSGVLGVGINARGFNSAFNPKNLQLNDNRLTTLIATGLPLGALSTTVKEDVERIEVILGPSSALYGPNAHNGLLNTITKDPRTSQGTTVAVGVGNQNVLSTRFRHANKLSDKFAYKVSAEYLKGTEFDYTDTVYYVNTAFDNKLFGGAGNGSKLIRHKEPELELNRDFSSLRGEAGLYYSPTSKSDLILSYGHSTSSNIGITNAGRNQIKDWQINWFQLRYVSPRFFIQAYQTYSKTEDTYAMNQRTQNYWSFKDAGFTEAEARRRSFGEQWFGISPTVGVALNRNSVFKDKSNRTNAEVQYNNSVAGFDYIFGVQYQQDRANSKGTYLLDGGETIEIGQVGGYLQVERKFGENFKAVGAARFDNHDLYGFNFIPKAALVYYNDASSFRLTYGRGIAAPTILNLEANIFGGVLLGNSQGYTLSDGTKIPALKVETIQTVEIGYKGTLGESLFVDANAYYNTSENFLSPSINIATGGRTVTHRGDQLMSAVVPGTPATGSALVLTYLNFGKVATYGADVSFNYRITSALLATLNYSWFGYDLDNNDTANDGNRDGKVNENDLPINTPTHKLGVGLNYSKGKFFSSFFGRYVQAYDFFSGINVAAKTNPTLIYAGSPVYENRQVGRNFNFGPLGGFFNVDLSAGYHFGKLTVAAQAINLFGSEVREFVASPVIGRLLSLEVKIDLPKSK